ncbi:hypothetical protein GCM10018980_68440 [Streptomyces capoamus]|uniref:Uncharacterized protein n=1 Tax=Streptomyces capoamus TaxID=68183 RepID=A0A919F2M3_9ACTN|nr:DUF6207 family protein [Streptomyces capoamus]GGP32420.1 hypothetical protein GCM10010501_74950 [Streptomyces libani subsp. rufus]GHG72561.1 hypothetical protein GCM10018980_68440 [Streptomyces capoamus]
MDLHEVHVSEPGLIVVNIGAADDQTAFAFHSALASGCGFAGGREFIRLQDSTAPASAVTA